ncbi:MULTISPECIES: alpha/beta hydrolase [unclassified Streptomyces]|uniref:alpha/beta hydrolase n=1 Tax=unclassified Streptomyces TaxID=2593676 RepID=UPI00380E401E
MTVTVHEPSPGVRRISLDADGVPLSALLAEPAGGAAPRALVVAVHGGGMNGAYFDGRAHPDQSLLTLGARLGLTVLAVDRPGYGDSRALLPDGVGLDEQVLRLRAAVADFAARHDTGRGVFLFAHSYGGKVALRAAAEPGLPGLLGVEVSGCGHVYALDPTELSRGIDDRVRLRRSWGPLRLYPPGTFLTLQHMVEPVPPDESAEFARWPEEFGAVAPRVHVPVRLTFAEHEAWWRHDDATLADLAARFTGTPRLTVERQSAAGHNLSLGRVARAYHLRALAFLEDCLAARPTPTEPAGTAETAAPTVTTAAVHLAGPAPALAD